MLSSCFFPWGLFVCLSCLVFLRLYQIYLAKCFPLRGGLVLANSQSHNKLLSQSLSLSGTGEIIGKKQEWENSWAEINTETLLTLLGVGCQICQWGGLQGCCLPEKVRCCSVLDAASSSHPFNRPTAAKVSPSTKSVVSLRKKYSRKGKTLHRKCKEWWKKVWETILHQRRSRERRCSRCWIRYSPAAHRQKKSLIVAVKSVKEEGAAERNFYELTVTPHFTSPGAAGGRGRKRNQEWRSEVRPRKKEVGGGGTVLIFLRFSPFSSILIGKKLN